MLYPAGAGTRDRRLFSLPAATRSCIGLAGERGYALATSPFTSHHSSVPTGEDEEEWLRHFRDPEDSREPMDPAWRDWFHALYVERGPLAPDKVLCMAENELLDRALEAGALVAADVWATLAQPADITARVHFERVRVVVNDEIANGSGIMSFDPSNLLVEVADAVQEIIMDDSRVWPECPQHNFGLHPELVDGDAVWVCRAGRHTIGRIGQLGETVRLSKRAAKRLERRKNRR
jgi:hypothetical protein